MVFRAASVACAIVILGSVAVAHINGQSFEQEVGEMFIDAGYDLPLTVGQSSLFDVQLFQMKNKKIDVPASFDSVQVQLFSGTLIQAQASAPKAEFGKTVLQITPKVDGNWNLHIQFTGKEITSATFEAPVLPYTRKINAWPIVIGVVVLGILIDMFFINRFQFVPRAKH